MKGGAMGIDEKMIERFRDRLACPCGCGLNRTEDGFARDLYFAQVVSGSEFVIISGFRCASHNAAVGGSEDNASVLGVYACISALDSVTRFRVIRALIGAGFERIGVCRRHVHVDRHPRGEVPSLFLAADL